MSSCWKILGIKRTQDRAVIRRSYAAKLKIINPEDDAEGFKVLRAAYEQALAYADRGNWRARVAETQATDTDATVDDDAVDKDTPATDVSLPIDPLAGHHAAQRLLASLLAPDASTSSDQVTMAFDAVLCSDAMQILSVRDETEAWAARLLISARPRSDPLLRPAIAVFGWDSRLIGRAKPAGVDMILKRFASVQVLHDMAQPDDIHHHAYLALRQPPQPITWRTRLLDRATPSKIKALLSLLHGGHSVLLPDFDQKTVAMWNEFFCRPRLKTMTLWGLVVSIPCLALIGLLLVGQPAFRSLAIFPALVPMLTACSLLVFYAGEWLRYLWRQKTGPDTAGQAWLRYGWAAVMLALLGVAAVPGQPFGTLLAVGALWVCVWVLATGEVDKRTAGDVPWQMRAIFAEGLLILWLIAVSFTQSTQAVMPLWFVMPACMTVSACGQLPAHHAWSSWPRGWRIGMTAVLMILAVAVIAMLVVTYGRAEWTAAGMAAATAVILLHRPVVLAAPVPLRAKAMTCGAALLFAHNFGEGMALPLGGIVLMLWVLIACGCVLAELMRPTGRHL